jgi:outer membrane protein assembly factor BamA
MAQRFNARFALLTTFAILIFPALMSAQIPRRLKRCLPYPTLADEIQLMSEQAKEKPDSNSNNDWPEPNIIVDSVTIRGGRSLPKTIRLQLIASARQLHWYSFDADRLNEFQEFGVRDILQSAGYFRAVVRVEGQILHSNPNSRHAAITMDIDEGSRFCLSGLQFRPADPDSESLPFSYEAMRTQIALQDGALFDTSKIRNGIESLSRLFQAHGYIDFTAEPQFKVGEKSHIIALTLVLDPQKQYRLRNVEIWGPDPVREELLQAQWKAGDVFTPEKVDNFFRQNKSVLPPDASEQDVQLSRDVLHGTIDLKFDFRECSSILNTNSLN